jgi:hypothetical protein
MTSLAYKTRNKRAVAVAVFIQQKLPLLPGSGTSEKKTKRTQKRLECRKAPSLIKLKNSETKQQSKKKQDDVMCQHYATKLLTIFLVPGTQATPGSTGLAAVCDQGLPERTRWDEVPAAPAVRSVRTKRLLFLWAPGPTVKYQAATPAAMITMMSTGDFVSRLFFEGGGKRVAG